MDAPTGSCHRKNSSHMQLHDWQGTQQCTHISATKQCMFLFFIAQERISTQLRLWRRKEHSAQFPTPYVPFGTFSASRQRSFPYRVACVRHCSNDAIGDRHSSGTLKRAKFKINLPEIPRLILLESFQSLSNRRRTSV